MNDQNNQLNEDIIWKSTTLMQTTIDLSIYRYTLSLTIGNLIVGVLLTGSISMLQIMATSMQIFIIGWIFLLIGAISIHLYVFRHVLRRIEQMKYENLMWLSYPFVYFVGYGVNGIMGNFITIQILWYPLLGLASLIIGLTIENYHYTKKELFARPILLFSLLLLVSTPLLFILATYFSDPLELIIVSSGLVLIIGSLNTSFAIAQAEKKVVKA